MDIPVLKVEQRQERGNGPARRARISGLIPAVCYGKGKEPLAISVDPIELARILKGPRGLNSLIRLDGVEDRTVFVQELQRHPVERSLLHVDFLSVDPDKKIQRRVPVELEGRPIGVKLGGLLQIARHKLMVEALPADLPDAIRIDVSEMDIGDIIHVDEVPMPEGVKAVYDRNFTICAVVSPAVEEQPETAEEEVEGEEGEKAEGSADAAEPKAESKEGGDAK